MERDFEKNPYTPHEQRVANYISKYGIGGGDDPVEFLIAAHKCLSLEKQSLLLQLNLMEQEIAELNGELEAIGYDRKEQT